MLVEGFDSRVLLLPTSSTGAELKARLGVPVRLRLRQGKKQGKLVPPLVGDVFDYGLRVLVERIEKVKRKTARVCAEECANEHE